MAYRNAAAGTGRHDRPASAEVAAAATALGRPVRIGQETNTSGTDPTEVKQTFQGMTLAQMEAQLTLVTNAFAELACLRGLAVHDSLGYAAITG